MNATLRAVAFDLDDTLTASKSKIDQQMAGLLGELLARLEVCIISGGRFEQIQAQVLQYLHAPPGDPHHDVVLARELLYRLEPELYGQLVCLIDELAGGPGQVVR